MDLEIALDGIRVLLSRHIGGGGGGGCGLVERLKDAQQDIDGQNTRKKARE
jgi:hypothetical protein